MKIRKYRNHFSIKFGGVNGENYMFLFEIHRMKPHFRITVCFNTDKLIKMFGFNQKNIEF